MYIVVKTTPLTSFFIPLLVYSRRFFPFEFENEYIHYHAVRIAPPKRIYSRPCVKGLNISIRWVNNEYVVSEDPIGLVNLPNTTANMLTQVIKDLLIRCGLPVSSCRGQAFDGAANMQGRKTIVYSG